MPQPLSTTASSCAARSFWPIWPTAAPSGDSASAAAPASASSSSPSSRLSANASASPPIATQHAEHEPRAQRLLGQEDPREHGGVQGQHAEQDGREARRDVLLAPVDEPVGERERRQREHRGEQPVRAQRAPPDRGEGQQHEAGQGESHTRPEQRRRVLEAELDRHPGARPDQDEQGVEPVYG